MTGGSPPSPPDIRSAQLNYNGSGYDYLFEWRPVVSADTYTYAINNITTDTMIDSDDLFTNTFVSGSTRDISDGNTVLFGVIAVNAYGESAPSITFSCKRII